MMPGSSVAPLKSGFSVLKSGRLTLPARQTASHPDRFIAFSMPPISAMPKSAPGQRVIAGSAKPASRITKTSRPSASQR